MDTLSERIRRVRNKVVDRRIRLDPPLAMETVNEFEQAQRIALPPEFRTFLLEVGNGGRGPPGYGLQPLSKTLQDESGVRFNPALPFPLTDYWVWEDEPVMSEELEALRESVWHQGFLFLGTDGCACHWILIVTGPERGQVWNLTDVGAQPCTPRRDFLAWYEFWLDGGTDPFEAFAWPQGKPTPRP